MTDNPTDDLLALAAAIAGSYPPGVLPGLHPIEILTGAMIGFEHVQARSILNDPVLLGFLAMHWSDHRPNDRYRRLAAQDNALGHLHREILRSVGYFEDLNAQDAFDQLIWIRPTPTSRASGSKGGEFLSYPEPETEWTLNDPFAKATVYLRHTAAGLSIGIVPEVDRGPARLQLRWSNPTDFTEHPVRLLREQPLTLLVEPPAPQAQLEALTFSPIITETSRR